MPFLLLTCVALGAAADLAHKTEPYQFKPQYRPAVPAELGSFTVPEVRTKKANGRTIRLHYVRFAATTNAPGHPIVYLAGGPGGSGIDAARGRRFSMFEQLRQLGDVIAFDQRGTGMSGRLPDGQPWNIPADRPATREVAAVAHAAAVKKSLADWREAGVNLEAYNTRESAHDLEALRLALGADKLRLCGISYGTHLALAYMRYFPESVGQVVLAGVEGPDHTVKLPIDQQRLLEQIDRWVQEQPAAREAYPDFLGSVERVMQRLRQGPVVIEKDGKVHRVITHFDIQRLTAGLLRGPEYFRVLPSLFKQMDDGQFVNIPFWISRLRGGRVRAMSDATDAASGRTEQRARMIQQQARQTLLGDAINFPYEQTRELLNVEDLGDEFRARLQSNVPVLAISGTADGRTPPGNAEEVLETLPNGVHLIIDGAGHSDPLFLSSPKIVETMLKFYRGEPVQDAKIELDPINFVLP